MLINEKTRYLVIPTSRTAEKTKVYIKSGEKLVLDLDVRLDFGNPETVFYYDLAPFMGLDADVSSGCGKSFGFSEKKPEPSSDKYRPKFHLTAGKGWINDPNGLCFYEGKYHVFFQHNPVGILWGNMHWGHAVSDDLVTFTELGDILYPDESGDMFSGSAIVDTDNLLGLKENEHDPLILFYTAAGNEREISSGKEFTQCIAYSTDGGNTFRKWKNNPVLPHIKANNRDPKVIRVPDSDIYVMALYLDGDEYALLTSKNLSDWKELCRVNLPGDNECPDFYPLTDEDGNTKWVLTGAHDCALIGDFDPERGFVNYGAPQKFGFGKAYAAQSFDLGGDTRRIRMAWNRFGIPSDNFNCELGIPFEVSLKSGKLRLFPAKEIEDRFTVISEYKNLPSHGVSFEIQNPCYLSFELSRSEEPVTINLFGNELKLDAAGILTVNGTPNGVESIPLRLSDGKAEFSILADSYGIEIYDHSGLSYGAFAVVPVGNTLTVGGEGSLDRLTVRGIR